MADNRASGTHKVKRLETQARNRTISLRGVTERVSRAYMLAAIAAAEEATRHAEVTKQMEEYHLRECVVVAAADLSKKCPKDKY
jgi:hypothetical protein